MSYCLQCGEDRGHLRWCDDYRPKVIYSNTTPRARTSDPETSHHAAGTVSQLAVTRTQNLILEALRGQGPLRRGTLHSARRRSGRSRLGVRRPYSPLRAGHRRPNRRHRPPATNPNRKVGDRLGHDVKTLGINVWPAKDFDPEFLIFELEVETPLWTLTQRVHFHDLPAAIEESVQAVMSNETPRP